MNKILLIDIAFTTMTFINLLLYLITGENQNTLYFGLCVTSILLMMLWFAIRCMKFRNQKNESHWLLTLLTISNVMQFAAINSEAYPHQCSQILLHVMSIQNQSNLKQYIAAIIYCISCALITFRYQMIIVFICTFILMIHKNIPKFFQLPSSYALTKKSKAQSFTWNPEFKEITNQKQQQNNEILSSPNFSQQLVKVCQLNQKEFHDIFNNIEQLNQNPVVIIDSNVKVISQNQAYELIVQGKDKQSLKFGLISMRITKIDKKTNQLLEHKKEKLKLKQLFLRQQSLANTKVLSSSTDRKIISLNSILQCLDFDHKQCQILEFTSEQFNQDYTVNISWVNGLYVFCFSNIKERDEFKIKQNTQDLMKKLFRSFSHEFSTSLNCIRILAENAMDELNQDVKTKYIQPIVSSCYILNSIVQDIKDYSMILSKNFVLSLSQTDICLLLYDTIQLFQNQLQMKGIQIQIISDEYMIVTDRQRVQQCIINLLSNAQKFTEKGSIILRTGLEQFGDMKLLKFSVEDTGSGIEETECEKLRHFLNIQSQPRLNSQSYGIGLLISDRIAKGLCPNNHGGIKFQSEVNLGSQFWFYVQDIHKDALEEQDSRQTIKYNFGNNFSQNQCQIMESFMGSQNFSRVGSIQLTHQLKKMPFLQAINSDDRSENFLQVEDDEQIELPYQSYEIKKPEDIKQKQKLEHFEDCNILIIDDEYINIYALTTMLNSMKLKCEWAGNGFEGLQKFIQKQFKVIFMDIEMPVMNGFIATQKIRQYCKANQLQYPIIIAQTAYTDLGTKQACLDAGTSLFLQKPISTNEIKKIFKDFVFQ